MKKLTTVQVTPITQKGAVISPIQCEVKCGAAPHEVIRMVRSQVGAEHSKDTLYINSDAPIIDNGSGVYNAYAYSRRHGVRFLGSMSIPNRSNSLRAWLQRLFKIDNTVESVIIDTVPPTVVTIDMAAMRTVYLISEYVGKPGKEKLHKSFVVDPGSVDNAVMTRAMAMVQGEAIIGCNADKSEYVMEDDSGKSYIWRIKKETGFKPETWQQPCWECANAITSAEDAEELGKEVRGCPWSKSFRPVPDWDAIKVAGEDSYRIVRCPMFKKG